MYAVLLVWICCVLSEDMSFEHFSPIWSPVNENEKKILKNNKKIIKKFEKQTKKWCGDMVKRYLSTKFGLLDGYSEDGFYGRRTDGLRTNGWMTDARVTTVVLLCTEKS